MSFIGFLLFPALGHIVYTDFKEYKIRLLAVILVIIVSVFRLASNLSMEIILQTLLLNLMLILILLGVVLIYCRIRHISFAKSFGLGDSLFLVIALLSFAPFSFIIYIIASSLFGILYFLVLHFLGRNQRQIPYAGIMAAILFLILLIDASTAYSTFSDSWLIKLQA